MPTGYTAMIDVNPKLTTAKWVTKGLSRAFGVCVTLRDDSMNLSEKEIESRLEKEIERSTQYYKEELQKAEEELKQITDDPERFWREKYAVAIEHIEKRNAEQIKEKNKIKSRHDQVWADLVKLRNLTTDETTRNIAQYGLDQLELAKSDTEPWVTEIPSPKKFREDKLSSIKHDIDYYSKEIKETQERETARLEAYKKIKSEVSRILNVGTSVEKVTEAET